ncbi:MAG TPA: hypothetical protein VF338_12075 [Leptolinea sp.]
MALPLGTDAVWKDLLLKKRTCDFEFLALKMLLGRLIMDIERDPSPVNIDKCVSQLHDLLDKNQHLPSAHRDIQKISG